MYVCVFLFSCGLQSLVSDLCHTIFPPCAKTPLPGPEELDFGWGGRPSTLHGRSVLVSACGELAAFSLKSGAHEQLQANTDPAGLVVLFFLALLPSSLALFVS